MVQRPAKMVALVILPACFLAGQVARQAGPISASAILSGAYSVTSLCRYAGYDKRDRVACRRYGVGQYDNLNTMPTEPSKAPGKLGAARGRARRYQLKLQRRRARPGHHYLV